MKYENYNGLYLEGLISQGQKCMNAIKKYSTFNLSLLQANEISSMSEVIDQACLIVKNLDFYRYKSARKYSNNTSVDKLDKYLAIDNIIYNDELNRTIGVDWTTNINTVQDKVYKHQCLKEATNLVVDISCVVCITNEDALDNCKEAQLAKSIYSLLKIIDREVSKKNFAGYVIIDSSELIK